MSTYSSVSLNDHGLDKHPKESWWDIATSPIDEPLRICYENAELYLDDENARRVYRELYYLFGPIEPVLPADTRRTGEADDQSWRQFQGHVSPMPPSSQSDPPTKEKA